ncbi:hypothetical protein ACNQT2_11670, partial [Corynebacterium diphtheriae]
MSEALENRMAAHASSDLWSSSRPPYLHPSIDASLRRAVMSEALENRMAAHASSDLWSSSRPP